MKNLWSDKEARAYVRRYARDGVNRDVALRVYTTRLLGGDPQLVLHGGGNTSVKTVATDLTGEKLDVLCVKGSGWDMGDIEPAGLPAVQIAPLRNLDALDRLGDEDMVNAQRRNLPDSKAPNPSVETLLHAFLPHKFVDHTIRQRFWRSPTSPMVRKSAVKSMAIASHWCLTSCLGLRLPNPARKFSENTRMLKG